MQVVVVKKSFFRKYALYIISVFLAVFITVCIFISVSVFSNQQPHRQTGFAMGTAVLQTLYGTGAEQTAQKILHGIAALEVNLLSHRVTASAVAVCNRSAGSTEIDPRLADWLSSSLRLAGDSGGAFNPAMGALIDLWGVESADPAVPSREDLAEALKHIDYTKLTVSGSNVIREDPALLIDLGAVGKGIACDYAREQLRGSGVSGGVVSTGSSVLVYGAKPGGAAFDIGIRDPLGGPNDLLGVLRIENGVISTSGGYEKYFEADGTRYHHIFDGKTGYPSDSGLLSVSVFCESGLLSDGLSTACYVLGYERSLELLKQYNAEAVFVLEDKTVRITVGLRQYFTLENSAYAVV